MEAISFVTNYKYWNKRENCVSRLHRLSRIIMNQKEHEDEFIISDQSNHYEEIFTDDMPYSGFMTPLVAKFDKYVLDPQETWNRSRCLNQGIKLANNKYVCTIDIDIMPPLHFIRDMRPLLEPNALIVFDIREGNDIIHSGIPGFCIIFSKAKCEEIGYWDEDFIGYGHEDNDFRDRLLEAGCFLKHFRDYSLEHDPHPRPVYFDAYRNDWDNETVGYYEHEPQNLKLLHEKGKKRRNG